MERCTTILGYTAPSVHTSIPQHAWAHTAWLPASVNIPCLSPTIAIISPWCHTALKTIQGNISTSVLSDQLSQPPSQNRTTAWQLTRKKENLRILRNIPKSLPPPAPLPRHLLWHQTFPTEITPLYEEIVSKRPCENALSEETSSKYFAKLTYQMSSLIDSSMSLMPKGMQVWGYLVIRVPLGGSFTEGGHRMGMDDM